MLTLNNVRNYVERTMYTVAQLDEIIRKMNLHVGEYKWSARSHDFGGWLVCDGRALSKTQYKDLFDVIGTTFGEPDEDSFNLPDYRGKVMAMPGQGADLGDDVGSKTHTLTVGQLPLHTHSGTVDSAGAHIHTASTAAAGSHNHGGNTGTAGSHTHTTNATGGQGGVGLVTANGYNTVIDTDTSQGELNVWTTPIPLTVDAAGAHNHTISSDGSHTHAVTVDSAGAHTHTFTTLSTGLGQAFNIMQPTAFGGFVLIFAGMIFETPEPMIE